MAHIFICQTAPKARLEGAGEVNRALVGEQDYRHVAVLHRERDHQVEQYNVCEVPMTSCGPANIC